MIRFNNYTTNTLDEMFDHFQEDCEAAGLTLHDRQASSLIMTDGTYYICFLNSGNYCYASVGLDGTITGNYLTNYIWKYDSTNNFYYSSVYNAYFSVAKRDDDYIIGFFKTNATLQYFPVLISRFKTTKDRFLWADLSATPKYYDNTGTNVGTFAHQIASLVITDQTTLYKRNLNVTLAGGSITDDEYLLNVYDVCFPTIPGDRKYEYIMNDGRYVTCTIVGTAQNYLFRHEGGV